VVPRNGEDRRGQTLPVTNQIGQSIHVVVSASLWGQYGFTEAKSAEVSIPAVKLPSPGVVIQGEAKVSSLLTAVLSVPAGLDPAAVNDMTSPQWYRNGAPISGATELTYRPVPADAGAVLSFKAGGLIHPAVKTAKIAPREFYGAWGATLKGTPKPGSTLTVLVGAWDPRPTAFAYQWYRSGVRIPGATAKSYKLTSADAGKTIMVKATGTRTGFLTMKSASVRALR
jgi:hypothetical protein